MVNCVASADANADTDESCPTSNRRLWRRDQVADVLADLFSRGYKLQAAGEVVCFTELRECCSACAGRYQGGLNSGHILSWVLSEVELRSHVS